MQCGGLGDPYRLVLNVQAGGTLEGQSAAAGTRADDDRLPHSEFAGHGCAKRLGAVSRTNDVDQLGVLQRGIDVMT